jgi:hypothetical protein
VERRAADAAHPHPLEAKRQRAVYRVAVEPGIWRRKRMQAAEEAALRRRALG